VIAGSPSGERRKMIPIAELHTRTHTHQKMDDCSPHFKKQFSIHVMGSTKTTLSTLEKVNI